MATDLASLEILITERGGDVVLRTLDQVASAGERAERSTTELTGAQEAQAGSAQRLATSSASLASATQGVVTWSQRAATASLALATADTQAATARDALVAAATAPSIDAASKAAEAAVRASQALATADANAAKEREALNAAIAATPSAPSASAPSAADAGAEDRVAKTRALSQAQQELVVRAQQWAAAAAQVDASNDAAVKSFIDEAVAIRGVASELRSMSSVEDALQAGGRTLDANRKAAQLLAAETDAYAEAAQRAALAARGEAAAVASVGAATTGATAATEAQAVAATGAAASGGALARMFGGLASAAGLGGAGVSGLAGSLASMVVGGVIISGVLAGIGALVNVYRDLTKSEREAKEAAEAFKQSDAGIAARARAQAMERAVSGDRAFQGGLLTPKIDALGATKEITEAMKVAQGLRAELAKPIHVNLDFENNLNPFQLRAFNNQVGELQKQFAAGNLSAEQFAHGLDNLERAFPGFERQILQARELGATYDDAAKAIRRLQAAEANRVAEGRAAVAASGVPGTSFDQGGDAAVRLAEQRKALAEAQQDAAAAAAGGAMAVQKLHDQREATAQATAGWRDYAIATGNAAAADISFSEAINRHIPAAIDLLRTSLGRVAEARRATTTIAVQGEETRSTGEIDKLRALNAAYRESELALRVLSIQLDATNQKRANKLQYEGADLARVNALVDATARERIQSALLSDSLERENRLRAARDANAGALEAAVNATKRASMTGPDAEVQAIRDRAQEEIDAAKRAHDAKTGLTAAEQATEDAITRERIANIREVEAADLERLQRARAEATKESIRSTVRDNSAEAAGIQAMIAAELAGGRAAEQMRIQLAGNEAVQRALNEATARGTTVTQEQADQLRRSAEELERTRINAEKLRAVYREVAGAANQFFTDVFNRKNPGPALAERIKQMIIGALAEAVARPITVTIGKILNIAPPEDKQIKAAKDMNTAADKMLRAAGMMNDTTPGGDTGDGTFADASVVLDKWGVAKEQFKKAMGVAGAGLGGYGAGYGIGQATGSGVLGAIGGAAAGAKMGAAFGPPGMVVGALAGFAGGIIGAGDAAEEAATKLEEARRVFQRNWDSIVAEIRGDSLAAAIAAAGDKFDQLRQNYVQTITVSGVLSGAFQQGYAKITELQKQYVAMLEREAAAKARSQIASYDERRLRAEGKTAEADAVRAKEERQQLIDSFGAEIDATERQILASYDAAAAAEKNAAAVNALTTAIRGGPSGFKLNGYIQQYAPGAPYPTTPAQPYTPPVWLPPGGLTPPSGPQYSQSSTGKVATAGITVPQINITVTESKDAKATAAEVRKMFIAELDTTKNAVFGLNGTRAQALERM